MKCSQLCLVANRIGGIIIWVGVWNLLDMVVKDDVIGNILYSVLGLGIWAATGEFKEVDRYIELSNETYPVSNDEDTEAQDRIHYAVVQMLLLYYCTLLG